MTADSQIARHDRRDGLRRCGQPGIDSPFPVTDSKRISPREFRTPGGSGRAAAVGV